MNFIQLEPASLTIGYVCGTLLCYYIMEMFHAKESEYDNESKKGNFYPKLQLLFLENGFHHQQ